jgi:hypothetical protein
MAGARNRWWGPRSDYPWEEDALRHIRDQRCHSSSGLQGLQVDMLTAYRGWHGGHRAPAAGVAADPVPGGGGVGEGLADTPRADAEVVAVGVARDCPASAWSAPE